MNGDVILELTSADIPGALDAITTAGVMVYEMTQPRGLSLRFRINRQDLKQVQTITEKRGESLRQILRLGAYWKLQGWARHWVLSVGIAAILFLTAWLPTKVLFLRVEGNVTIPDRLILEKAAECGIVFGADRGEIRSERIKNALMDSLPELQWAGINTVGCAATISVKERSDKPGQESLLPGNVVAIRDGIIEELTAERGTALKQVGQAVRAGEVLISGYADHGGVILFSGGKGEVYGRTQYKLSARTPEITEAKEELIASKTKFSVVFGKNRINFYEDSGILDTGCVKMYSEYYLTLPGGFALPIKLVVITENLCHWEEATLDPYTAELLLTDQTQMYLLSQMTAGQILSAKTSVSGYSYQGEYVCREMIGRLVYEEIIQHYGEDHGTNGECRTG